MFNKKTFNSGLVITFDTPKVIKNIGGVNLKTKKLTVIKTVDDAVNKTVEVYTDQCNTYILWSGATYDSIGQWTDANVETRLREIILSGS